MQLPISLPGLGHVNCYVLTDADGITVVDPGLPGPQSWKALKQRLAATGNKVADIRRVVVTHSHPDHFGGAGTIRHESGADIITHETFRTWFDPTEEEGEADDAADEAGDPVRADVAVRPDGPMGRRDLQAADQAPPALPNDANTRQEVHATTHADRAARRRRTDLDRWPRVGGDAHTRAHP